MRGSKFLLLVWNGWVAGKRAAAGKVKIREAAHSLGGRGVPFVAQAEVDRKVGLPFEAILGKDAVGRLQYPVIARAEQDGEGGSLIGEEIRHRRESKAADVLRDIVVVAAADFAAERHGVTAFQPAEGVVEHHGGVAASLRFTDWSAKIHVAQHVDIRYAHALRSPWRQGDIKIRRIQSGGSKGEVNAVVAEPHGIGK